MMIRHADAAQRTQLRATTDPSLIRDLVQLENRCFTSYYAPHRFDAADFAHHLRSKQTVNIVATAGSAVVGYVLGVVVRRDDRHIARILSLAVEREHRRRSIGSRLVKAFVRRVRERGCVAVYGEVAVPNRAALRLFTRLRFKTFRRLPDYYADGVDGVRMRLALEE